ncbi:amidohydrolase family protein [Heliobacillus mobilis]|uniref:Amidohydrolase family protein n=1 Tax=Heliobacterium mobile TaxID=28064 RepID=A0A6I3SH49_HELMO|nr:amidohydrolase family protein [Heliobacterium mobile]
MGRDTVKRLIEIIGALLFLFIATFVGLYFGNHYLEKKGIELVDRPLHYDYVLKNGTIVDGTGKGRYKADIGIKKGKVTFIGIIQPPEDVKVIDASGLLILPGFVNLYSRLDGTADGSTAFDGLVKQGYTTTLSGYGALAQEDVTKHLEQAARSGLPINYAVLAGHQGLFNLLKDQQEKSEKMVEEPALEYGQVPPPLTTSGQPKPNVDDLLQELSTSLEQGAFGLTIDFDDQLGRQLTFEEMTKLAKALQEKGAVLALTLPPASANPDVLLQRVISLHKETKVRTLLSPWGYFGNASDDRLTAMEQDLRGAYLSTKEIYTCLYPSTRQSAGVKQTLQRAMAHYPAEQIEILEVGGENPKTLVGKTLAEIAQERSLTPDGAAKELTSAGLVQVTIRSSNQERIQRLASDPFVALTVDSGQGSGSEYSTDAVKDFLGRYVQDQNLFSWEEAAMKLSARPCAILGIEDRGSIKTGNWADLVVIDPVLLSPRSQVKKSGIRHVFVNGAMVFSQGKMPSEGQGKGQLLRFKSKPLMPEPVQEPQTTPVPSTDDEEEE